MTHEMYDPLHTGQHPTQGLAENRTDQEVTSSQASGHPRGVTIAELSHFIKPPKWLISGLLVENSTIFLAGPYKTLKSSIALDLILTQAWPQLPGHHPTFLNHFACGPLQHILYFSAEARPWELYHRIWIMITGKLSRFTSTGSQRSQSMIEEVIKGLRLTCYFESPRLSEADERRFLLAEIERTGASLVVIDPLYLAGIPSGVNASNLFEMGSALRAMEETILKAGATPLFVHHAIKGLKVGSDPTLADMAFAGSAERAAQWLLLNHRQPFDPDTGQARLIMSLGGRAGQCGHYGVDIHEGVLQADLSGRQWFPTVRPMHEIREAEAREAAARSIAEVAAGKKRRTSGNPVL